MYLHQRSQPMKGRSRENLLLASIMPDLHALGCFAAYDDGMVNCALRAGRYVPLQSGRVLTEPEGVKAIRPASRKEQDSASTVPVQIVQNLLECLLR